MGPGRTACPAHRGPGKAAASREPLTVAISQSNPLEPSPGTAGRPSEGPARSTGRDGFTSAAHRFSRTGGRWQCQIGPIANYQAESALDGEAFRAHERRRSSRNRGQFRFSKRPARRPCRFQALVQLTLLTLGSMFSRLMISCMARSCRSSEKISATTNAWLGPSPSCVEMP